MRVIFRKIVWFATVTALNATSVQIRVTYLHPTNTHTYTHTHTHTTTHTYTHTHFSWKQIIREIISYFSACKREHKITGTWWGLHISCQNSCTIWQFTLSSTLVSVASSKPSWHHYVHIRCKKMTRNAKINWINNNKDFFKRSDVKSYNSFLKHI